VPEGEERAAIEARLVTREDDTEDKFSKRIASFHANEATLLAAYPEAQVRAGPHACVRDERLPAWCGGPARTHAHRDIPSSSPDVHMHAQTAKPASAVALASAFRVPAPLRGDDPSDRALDPF
jgi:hypothetical protein